MSTESKDPSGPDAQPQEAAEVTTPDLPEPDLFAGVAAPLRAALERQGFAGLTPVQKAVLAPGCAGRDLRISSQTGSGKTVALGLALAEGLIEPRGGERPAGPEILIITPTRELAAQVRMELGWLFADVAGVTLEVVTGGTPVGPERRRLARGPRILVGTPGRLGDHLRSGALVGSAVTHVVLDEADQMLDMGFRDELEAILDTTPTERRTHLISATFPDAIRQLASRYQRDALHLQGSRLGEANPDIEHVACLVQNHSRYAGLVNLLLITGAERTLVFVATRADTAEVAEKLTGDGFAALPLSGDLGQPQRTRTLAAFKNGQAKVLVATDVAARGLDVPDVAAVIHAVPPLDGEIYTHRSGRTGRAGRKGLSLILCPGNQQRRVERLLREAGTRFQWRDLPTPDAVNEVLVRRERERLQTWLDDSVAPDDDARALAAELLEGREAPAVVATLLANLPKQRPCDPKPIQRGFSPPSGGRQGGSGYGQSGYGQSNYNHSSYGRPNQGRPAPGQARPNQGQGNYSKPGGYPPGGYPPRPAASPGHGSHARFFINLGAQTGADARRVLAIICRRGGVSSGDVGRIDIRGSYSLFEIQQGAAAEFERRAGQPDSRDPRLRIAPARDSEMESDGGSRRGGGPRRGWSNRGGPRGGGPRRGGFRRRGGRRRVRA
jgi:ATP-dependent RNA helicase DeaD